MSDISTGNVVSRAFDALGRNRPGFALLAVAMVAVPSFLSAIFTLNPELPTVLAPNEGGALGGIVLLLTFLFKGIVIGTLVLAGEAGRPDLRAGALAMLRRILPMIGIAVLSWIAILIGLVLLIFPGVIAYCMFAVSVPVTMAEGRGVIESLSRSKDLTDGNKGAVFLLFFLFGILQTIASAILALVVSAAGQLHLVQALAAALLSTVSALVEAAITASLYVELRTKKEGGFHDELAEVFA